MVHRYLMYKHSLFYADLLLLNLNKHIGVRKDYSRQGETGGCGRRIGAACGHPSRRGQAGVGEDGGDQVVGAIACRRVARAAAQAPANLGQRGLEVHACSVGTLAFREVLEDDDEPEANDQDDEVEEADDEEDDE